ncbi:hypothetical protein FX985_03296 [Pseudomonas extremaustralis]|uniref:Uncharacterized protein n=1 Tax=Pseudomonas extremaustralis TaxID=359110 RepID=A0A5M9J2G7_9PSED|nr:hypothetical protein [Pseudomonas extremaustralis]KAA8563228.1 hypothetical protein FX985_03296 [Pseudomonas extremaustralis]
MTDYTDLKSIAEACQGHQPLRLMRSHGALYIRNDNGIVFDVHQNRSFPDLMAQNKDYADLVLAASPAAILALIKDLDSHKRMLLAAVCDLGAIGEALKSDMDDDGDALLGMVIDLKAQNTRMLEWLKDISRTSGDKGAVMGARQLLKEFAE